MIALARLRIVILAWAGASLFFTAVLEISELGHKPLRFALYSNSVHFALWTLVLPFLTRCTRKFPLNGPRRDPKRRSADSGCRGSRGARNAHPMGYPVLHILPLSRGLSNVFFAPFSGGSS